jgi:diguanylate cyclase (GGDEF)-like protein
MITLSSALPASIDESQLEVKPVAVTRWTARLVDATVEQSFLESRFKDERRRVLVLLGFIAIAGLMIIGGRFIAHLQGHGPLTGLWPPVVPVAIAACGACLLLRMKSPQALELCLIGAAIVTVLTRFATLTLQPAMTDSWLPLMVTSLFIIYVYLPVRLFAAAAFAAFYSAVSLTWWGSLYGGLLGAEQIYFGILWAMLANGLGYTAARSLQRSQRIQYAQKLVMQQLLATDALTGIANRRSFDEVIANEWRRCARAGRPLSLLMIDVDHFKAYNDRFGHQKGDACLRRLARVLVDCIAAPDALVARYGGEEFVCLLPGADQRAAAKLARRVTAALDRAAIIHPTSPDSDRITLSIGVATADAFVTNETALLTLADELLYAAKNGGRNRIVSGELPFEQPIVRAA